MKNLSRVGLLAIAALLIIGFFGLTWKKRRNKNTHEEALTGSVKAKVDGPIPTTRSAQLIPASHREEDSVRAKARLFEILAKYRSDPMFAKGGMGFPFNDYPPFWSLVAEIKKALGNIAAPTLVALIAEAQSEFFKLSYTALLVALKDPAAEPMITALAADLTLESELRGMAIYGLGLLKTESAWQTILAYKAKDSREAIPFGIYCAIAQFGERAVDMLVSEVTTEVNTKKPGLASFVLYELELSPSTLDRLIKHPVPQVRQGLFAAMGRRLTTAQLPHFLDLATQEPDLKVRTTATLQVQLALRADRLDFSGAPEILSRLRATYDTLPPEIQTALLTRPEIRAEFPGRLEQLLNRVDLIGSPYASTGLVYALASDPSTHALLAQTLKQDWHGMSFYFTSEALVKRGGFSDPTLASALVDLALDAGAHERHFLSWSLLAVGPQDARAKALEAVPHVFAAMKGEADRASYAGAIQMAGPDGASTLLTLLSREESPVVQMELACGILSSTRKSHGSTTVDRIVEGVAPMFRPESEVGIRYAMNNPNGYPAGLDRYTQAIRDYYGRYGTVEQIPDLLIFADRLRIPPELVADSSEVEHLRKRVNEAILQSIDDIRARRP